MNCHSVASLITYQNKKNTLQLFGLVLISSNSMAGKDRILILGPTGKLLIEDQLKINAAIKEAGNIKVSPFYWIMLNSYILWDEDWGVIKLISFQLILWYENN